MGSFGMNAWTSIRKIKIKISQGKKKHCGIKVSVAGRRVGARVGVGR